MCSTKTPIPCLLTVAEPPCSALTSSIPSSSELPYKSQHFLPLFFFSNIFPLPKIITLLPSTGLPPSSSRQLRTSRLGPLLFQNPWLLQHSGIRTYPVLLAFDPNKTILPKLNFLLSKGASISDLVQIVTKNPRFLCLSLENSITPCYDLVKRFMLSDESTLLCIKGCAAIIYSKNSVQNVQLLLENGIPKSKIALTLRNWPYTVIVSPHILKKAVEEVKELGFNPISTLFIVAVRAMIMGKSLWEKKFGLYKKWGWSEDIIFSTFVKYPWCMLASVDKIEAVMQFLVNHMGWESLVLAKLPLLLMLSL